MTFDVDLTNPDVLREAISSYLSHGVCPVRHPDAPPVMSRTEVRIRLPLDRIIRAEGDVIRHMGPEFLVQLHTRLELERLSALAEQAPPGEKLTGRESGDSDIYSRLKGMNVTDKQKLARSANRILRALLIKDRIKQVHVFVMRNPKVTFEEAMEFSKLPGLSKEAIRVILENRTWMSSRQLTMNLVRNPATPLDAIPGLLKRLSPNDWKVLSRPGSSRPQVQAAAKKLLVEKKL